MLDLNPGPLPQKNGVLHTFSSVYLVGMLSTRATVSSSFTSRHLRHHPQQKSPEVAVAELDRVLSPRAPAASLSSLTFALPQPTFPHLPSEFPTIGTVYNVRPYEGIYFHMLFYILSFTANIM